MKRIATACLLWLAASGRAPQATPGPAPVLVDQGALYVYVQPPPRGAPRIAMRFEAAAAEREGGPDVPLAVFLRDPGADGLIRERRLAGGALPPGRYAGLKMRISGPPSGTRGEAGRLSEEPLSLPFPFTIERRQARVLILSMEEGDKARPEGGAAPQFRLSAPTQPAVALLGAVSCRGANLLALFDKSSGRIAGIVPTGRMPSGLALDPVRRRAYVAVPGDDEIESVGLLEQTVLARVPLKGGDEPVELALTSDGRTLLSANSGSSTVSVLDAVSLVETDRIQVGHQPRSVALDPAGRRAYVFNSGSSTITVIDLASRALIGTISTEAGPFRGQFNSQGDRLYVIHKSSPYVTLVDPATLTVSNRIYAGLGTTAIKVDSRNERIYVARRNGGQVDVYDPLSLLPLDFLQAAGDASYLTIDDEGNNLYLALPGRGEVEVLRIVGKAAVARADVGEDPYGIVLLGER